MLKNVVISLSLLLLMPNLCHAAQMTTIYKSSWQFENTAEDKQNSNSEKQGSFDQVSLEKLDHQIRQIGTDAQVHAKLLKLLRERDQLIRAYVEKRPIIGKTRSEVYNLFECGEKRSVRARKFESFQISNVAEPARGITRLCIEVEFQDNTAHAFRVLANQVPEEPKRLDPKYGGVHDTSVHGFDNSAE